MCLGLSECLDVYDRNVSRCVCVYGYVQFLSSCFWSRWLGASS